MYGVKVEYGCDMSIWMIYTVWAVNLSGHFLELGHSAAYANSSLLEDERMIHGSHAPYWIVTSRIVGFQQVLLFSRPIISAKKHGKYLNQFPQVLEFVLRITYTLFSTVRSKW